MQWLIDHLFVYISVVNLLSLYDIYSVQSLLFAMSLREPTPTRRMSALPKPLAVPKPYQVEEMQVKIRELEGTIEKLKTALNTEQTRSKDTVQKIQQTWTKERAEWQAGCDAIQVAHRINFLKTAIEVDNQKAAVLREKDGYRIHQISRLQRDFNLVKFQLHEVEQEERHAQLEDEVERLQEALEDARSTFQEELDSFRERCEKVEKQLARKVEEAEGLLEEKSQIEACIVLIGLCTIVLRASWFLIILPLSPTEKPCRSSC